MPEKPSLNSKLLLSAGTLVLVQALHSFAPPGAGGPLATPFVLADEGGEGGEGGDGLSSYALASTDPNAYAYDASEAIATYAAGVHASYQAALADAQKMQAAIDAFLAAPGEATLSEARAAWVAARPAYLVTETFRFYDGPIEEVEGFINAWPLNEGFIDSTEGAPQGGIINDAAASIDEGVLRNRNQTSDEADVTTGWHAIEFLLWGQDFSATGPGNRPYTDYVAGTGNNDRRRAYLSLVTKLLIDDLASLAAAWNPAASGNYAEEFRAMPPREAVGRMVNGMAILAGYESASQRMAVALESGDQEDEHSCFSDTTKQDFIFDLQGIENVWRGTYQGVSGAGLETLVRGRDAALADRINALLDDAKARIAALDEPWDQVLAQEPGVPARVEAEEAVTALIAFAKALKETGPVLGVIVQVEGL